MVRAPLQRRATFSEDFNSLDADGDQALNKEELVGALMRRLPGIPETEAEWWAQSLLRTYDKDGSGSLDRTEFAAFMNSRYDELQRIFDELDVSKTGRITQDDVKRGLMRADVAFIEMDVDRVFKRMGQRRELLGGVTADGVSFDAFFHASVLLPVHSSESLLMLNLSGPMPMMAPPPGTTPAMIVAAGFINGAVSRTATAPTDRLRAVLATGVYPDVRSAVRGILKQGGVLAFWSSNTANVVQVAPENGIAFALNELLRDKVCTDPAHPSIAEKFLLGGFAGAVAMSIVYPMYVVQNRQVHAF